MEDDPHPETERSALARGLEALSFRWLLILAAGMAVAPWPAGSMPHLIQKLGMLAGGTLHRPIDIFDLFVHALPSVLLLAKAVHRHGTSGATSGET